MTYLNARVKTINPRKKVGINLCSLGSANGFFSFDIKSSSSDFIKIKTFHTSKSNNNSKDKSQRGYLQTACPISDLHPEYVKESHVLKRQTTRLKNDQGSEWTYLQRKSEKRMVLLHCR